MAWNGVGDLGPRSLSNLNIGAAISRKETKRRYADFDRTCDHISGFVFGVNRVVVCAELTVIA